MIRKIYIFILCVLFIFSLPLPIVFATIQNTQFVLDNADLLSDSEYIELNTAAETLSLKYSIDVLIITVESLDGATAQNYAESLYDSSANDWKGYWDSDNAILFLLAMEEREWYISTAGNAIYAFTDYGLELLGDKVVPYLTEGYYFEGFSIYLDDLSPFLIAYQQGSPIDGYSSCYDPLNNQSTVYYEKNNGINLFASLLIGFVAASISILIMRGLMKTKRQQHSAHEYMRLDSYQLTHKSDLYLYSNVTKVRRQDNNSKGGGSTVHRSSGGRSHGGRGGKF